MRFFDGIRVMRVAIASMVRPKVRASQSWRASTSEAEAERLDRLRKPVRFCSHVRFC
jgi:hypothetical protein